MYVCVVGDSVVGQSLPHRIEAVSHALFEAPNTSDMPLFKAADTSKYCTSLKQYHTHIKHDHKT